jgi:hypothetical protein
LNSSEYPPVLDDAAAIAEYIESVTPDYEIDTEFIEEHFRGTHAVLRKLPIDSIREGNPDANLRSEAKERHYSKLNPETIPPLVVEGGTIEDGNHRYRVTKALSGTTIMVLRCRGR